MIRTFDVVCFFADDYCLAVVVVVPVRHAVAAIEAEDLAVIPVPRSLDGAIAAVDVVDVNCDAAEDTKSRGKFHHRT
jgi:hypothetical protein